MFDTITNSKCLTLVSSVNLHCYMPCGIDYMAFCHIHVRTRYDESKIVNHKFLQTLKM